MLRYLLVALGVLATVGCGGDSGDDASGLGSCSPGTEACACYGNGSCDVGLDCFSDLCSARGQGVGGSGAAGTPSGGTAGLGTGGMSPGDCVKACGARTCGPDPKCGASCGNCAAGLECVAGECRSAAPLLVNGQTCSTPNQCASSSCAESQVGEKRCYGSAIANGVCGDTYDCDGGVCLLRSLSGSQSVCVEGITVCLDNGVSDECTDAVLSYCRLIQFCGASSSSAPTPAHRDFDACTRIECTEFAEGFTPLTPPECLNLAVAIANGQVACP